MIRYVSDIPLCLPGYAGWWSGLPAAGLPTTATVAARCGRSPGAIARAGLEMAADVVRMADSESNRTDAISAGRY